MNENRCRRPQRYSASPEAAEFSENSGSLTSLLVDLLFFLSEDYEGLVCQSEAREGCSDVEQH